MATRSLQLHPQLTWIIFVFYIAAKMISQKTFPFMSGLRSWDAVICILVAANDKAAWVFGTLKGLDLVAQGPGIGGGTGDRFILSEIFFLPRGKI